MKTILVPVDFSAATTRVCEAACTLADQIGGRLTLLHVVQPPPVVMNEYYAFDAGQMAAAVVSGEKFADRKLAELARLYTKPDRPVEVVRETGQPVPTVLDRAEAMDAAYLVVGSHGHGALYDLFVGSTTQGIPKKAHCPVLVIPRGAQTEGHP